MIPFTQVYKLTKSRMKALELFCLIYDEKEVVRQGYFESEIQLLEQFCQEQGLFYVKSSFKVLIDDPEKEISDRGIRVAVDDPRKGLFFLYISKSELSVYQAAHAEITQNAEKLGTLLGYPHCCITFFEQNYQGYDLTLKPTSIYTNQKKKKND
ncbi:MAG: hypothetical protein ACMXYA_03535, partial [Candidatus Woesearchaeota archaeon]